MYKYEGNDNCKQTKKQIQLFYPKKFLLQPK